MGKALYNTFFHTCPGRAWFEATNPYPDYANDLHLLITIVCMSRKHMSSSRQAWLMKAQYMGLTKLF